MTHFNASLFSEFRASLCGMRKPAWILAALALAVGCGSTAKPAQQPPPPATPTTPATPVKKATAPLHVDRARLSAKLDAYVASIGKGLDAAHQFSGFVLVGQGDQVLYAKPWGYADRAKRIRADRNTNFRIGSVTKQFTAAAILQLQEKGRLSVEDHVSKYLPAFPKGDTITLHQLLTHTAGIYNYTNVDDPEKQAVKPVSVAKLIATFANKPLDFPPGSKFSYSNSGYVLLGAIIEKVSGERYGDYVRRHIFQPAGLTRTVYGDAPGMDDRALGYRFDKGALARTRHFDMSWAYAAGGVRSTAADLSRWHRVLAGDKVLSAASRKQLYTPAKKNYAYGWIVRNVGGKRVIAHDGGIPGFSTSFVRLMDDDIVIVVWSNNPQVPANPISSAALELVLGKDVAPLRDQSVLARLAQRVAGGYVISPESAKDLTAMIGAKTVKTIEVVSIESSGKALMVHPIGQGAVAMVHEKELVFTVPQVHAKLTFITASPGGPVRGLTLEQGRVKIVYSRDDKRAAAIKAKRGKATPGKKTTSGKKAMP